MRATKTELDKGVWRLRVHVAGPPEVAEPVTVTRTLGYAQAADRALAALVTEVTERSSPPTTRIEGKSRRTTARRMAQAHR